MRFLRDMLTCAAYLFVYCILDMLYSFGMGFANVFDVMLGAVVKSGRCAVVRSLSSRLFCRRCTSIVSIVRVSSKMLVHRLHHEQ